VEIDAKAITALFASAVDGESRRRRRPLAPSAVQSSADVLPAGDVEPAGQDVQVLAPEAAA
jgi:hypothetical protein